MGIWRRTIQTTAVFAAAITAGCSKAVYVLEPIPHQCPGLSVPYQRPKSQRLLEATVAAVLPVPTSASPDSSNFTTSRAGQQAPRPIKTTIVKPLCFVPRFLPGPGKQGMKQAQQGTKQAQQVNFVFGTPLPIP